MIDHTDEFVATPLRVSLPEELITYDIDSLDEAEVDAGLQPFLEEDWSCLPAEQEEMPGNMRDAPLAVETRKKKKSYHHLNSD